MVSKKIIADLIISQKVGGYATPYSKVDERDVFNLIDIVVGSLVAAEYERNVQKGEYTLNSDWISTYVDIPVFFSKSRNEKYITLPANPIHLPGTRAIKLVAPMEAQGDPFIVVDGNDRFLYNGLEAGTIKRTCYPEGKRIYFIDIHPKCCEVMVKLIGGTDGLDEDTPIPVPAITQELLFNKVSAILETQVRYKTKMSNDSNPNNP